MNEEYIGQISVTAEDLEALARYRAYKGTIKYIYISLALLLLIFTPSFVLIATFVDSAYIGIPSSICLATPFFYYMIYKTNIKPNRLIEIYRSKLKTEVKMGRISDIVSNRHND